MRDELAISCAKTAPRCKLVTARLPHRQIRIYLYNKEPVQETLKKMDKLRFLSLFFLFVCFSNKPSLIPMSVWRKKKENSSHLSHSDVPQEPWRLPVAARLFLRSR